MEAALDGLIAQLDSKFRFTEDTQELEYTGEREFFEYFFYKFKYMRAKMLRKTNML